MSQAPGGLQGVVAADGARMMHLVDDAALERSPVVANSAMNRERNCVGANSYAKELGLNPLEFLRGRLQAQEHAAWLDLCCGRGRALIEAGRYCAGQGWGSRIRLIGIDLVSFFDPYPAELESLSLQEASLSRWQPDGAFDLITCVHGLHYIGDKLDLICRAASWLSDGGVFLAHLDLNSLRSPTGETIGRSVMKGLRRAGFDYRSKRHLITCLGRREVDTGYQYLGADDTAGPNYTGQAAVASYYRPAMSP